ncbi:MAG TPA: hypothetical protein VFK80_02315, partial [Limnochordia bacterium]|nr:hypothetical protein [Limnochordia bacterium]
MTRTRSSRLSWFILALWAAVVLAAVPFAADVSHGLISGGFENPRDSAAWANAQLEQLPPGGRTAHSLLIEGASAAQVRDAWSAVRQAGAVPEDRAASAAAGAATPGG